MLYAIVSIEKVCYNQCVPPVAHMHLHLHVSVTCDGEEPDLCTHGQRWARF